MKNSTMVGIAIAVVLVVVLGGWYWWSTQQNAYAPAYSPSPSPSTAMGTNGSENQGNMGQPDNGAPQTPQPEGGAMGANGGTVLGMTTDTKLGKYLTATNGMTLYTYTKDTAGVSNCTGTCAANWPPYTVTSAAGLKAAAGLTGTLGTITRADGSLQLTYKGMPLYFWKGDTKVGDTTGQGVGGSWFVAKI